MARKKRKTQTISGLPSTKKFGGKSYTKVSCSKLKGAAKKRATTLRNSGKNARVVKNPSGGYCVYARGRKK